MNQPNKDIDHIDGGIFSFDQPEYSDWQCYLFGADNLIYTPLKGKVPNIFIRLMMKIFFGCRWVKKI